MNYYKLGGLLWTASGAGWTVIGYTFDSPPAILAAIGCLVAAAIFNEMGS